MNTNYEGNIIFDHTKLLNKRGDHFQLRLRVQDTKGAGVQFSASNPFLGHKGRRTVQACWHVYRDFFRAVYQLNDSAKIRTPLANYESREHFEDTFVETGYETYGSSPISPEYVSDRCECDH